MTTVLKQARMVRGSGVAMPAPPALRRGACPTLSAPMQTGDGLLARLRPASGAFTPEAFLALLDAAKAHGNGRLDITARGNLQIRGLRPDSVRLLAEALDAAGIVALEGLVVETPPLAGLDPLEIADPRPLAASLSASLAAARLVLAPKLSIVVDGGGRIGLSDVPADLRLEAAMAGDRTGWSLSVAQQGVIAFGSAGDMSRAALTVLQLIAAIGPQARARDLDLQFDLGEDGQCEPRPVRVCSARVPPAGASPVPVGIVRLGNGIALGLAPAFGQMEARQARHLVLAAIREGLSDIRLAPGRGLLLLGLPDGAVPGLSAAARRLGFSTEADDPALRIDACAGARGCASGAIETQATARLLMAEARVLLDGSVDVHVSGCAKGCARPRAAGLVLVGGRAGEGGQVRTGGQAGTGDGHGLVLDGLASGAPVAISRPGDAPSSIAALGRLVAQTKHSGESAASCLKRLGPARIAASFQRD